MRLDHSLKSAPSPSRDPDPSPGPPVAAAVGHTCRGAGRRPRGAGPSLAACSRVGPGPGQLHSSPESSPHFLLCLEFWLFLNKQKPGRGAPGTLQGSLVQGSPAGLLLRGPFRSVWKGTKTLGRGGPGTAELQRSRPSRPASHPWLRPRQEPRARSPHIPEGGASCTHSVQHGSHVWLRSARPVASATAELSFNFVLNDYV